MKSFVHVRDVVRGVLLALERGVPGTYHFSVPSEMTVVDVVRKICDIMNKDLTKVTRMVDERLGQDARYWLDCSKAEKELGWRPQIPFTQGIQEVIAWIEEYWSKIQGEPLEYIHRV